MRENAGTWRIFVTAPDEAAADIAAQILGSQAEAVSAFEVSPGGEWKVEGFTGTPPDRQALEALAAVAALGFPGCADFLAGIEAERLPDEDWVALNQASFPPLRMGRYFVHGSHHEQVPAGAIGLRIDAAAAFGTGEHATTRGCLLALDRLSRQRRFRRVLDMGTGTAILAMGAARSWAKPVLACDIDAGSLRVAAENLRGNGLARFVRLEHSDGYQSRLVAGRAPFDLIVANILARPLMRMAPDLARHLAPDGVVVLSGLLLWQIRAVLAAHHAQGLTLRRLIAINGWGTLILSRGDHARGLVGKIH